jgi:hypothetical protein
MDKVALVFEDFLSRFYSADLWLGSSILCNLADSGQGVCCLLSRDLAGMSWCNRGTPSQQLHLVTDKNHEIPTGQPCFQENLTLCRGDV